MSQLDACFFKGNVKYLGIVYKSKEYDHEVDSIFTVQEKSEISFALLEGLGTPIF